MPPHSMTNIQLPTPKLKGRLTLEEAIYLRTSIRRFSSQPLTIEHVSQILWAAQGRTQKGFRSAPSAAATYPLHVSILVGDDTVVGLAAGVYAYHSRSHSLENRSLVDSRMELAFAASGEDMIATAPLDIVISAIYLKTTSYCGKRGERYVHLETGHAAQNIYLQVTALELGTVVVGLFKEAAVRQVLGIDESFTPLYIMPVGNPAR